MHGACRVLLEHISGLCHLWICLPWLCLLTASEAPCFGAKLMKGIHADTAAYRSTRIRMLRSARTFTEGRCVDEAKSETHLVLWHGPWFWPNAYLEVLHFTQLADILDESNWGLFWFESCGWCMRPQWPVRGLTFHLTAQRATDDWRREGSCYFRFQSARQIRSRGFPARQATLAEAPSQSQCNMNDIKDIKKRSANIPMNGATVCLKGPAREHWFSFEGPEGLVFIWAVQQSCSVMDTHQCRIGAGVQLRHSHPIGFRKRIAGVSFQGCNQFGLKQHEMTWNNGNYQNYIILNIYI